MSCYKAKFSNNGNLIASVGADKLLIVQDMRKPGQPLFINYESKSSLFSCDFLPNNQEIVTTAHNGEVSIISMASQKRIHFHDSVEELVHENRINRVEVAQSSSPVKRAKEFSNTVYCCQVIPDDNKSFLIGAEDKCVTKLST